VNQPPVLWAPRFRTHLCRALAWADRRKAARLARVWLDHADAAWRLEYDRWWWDHGWLQGADTADQAYAKVQATRR
jgi:hypothetical protein